MCNITWVSHTQPVPFDVKNNDNENLYSLAGISKGKCESIEWPNRDMWAVKNEQWAMRCGPVKPLVRPFN